MNRSQRIGLAMISLFYGVVAAAPLLMMVVLFRYRSNWHMLVQKPNITISILLTVSVFQGLVAAITWCVSGLPMVAFWPIESMRRHVRLAYASASGIALLSAGLLAAALVYSHRRNPKSPLMGRALFFETAGFTLVAAAVAINRYFSLTRKAEAVLTERTITRP